MATALKIPDSINETGNGRYRRKLLYAIPVICVGILLLQTYQLYKFAYFGSDDFHNLYFVQTQSFAQMIGYIVNPVSSYFRPTGMMCYWILLRFFDLNPAPYHWFAWSLHGANTALLYFILKRFTESRAGAAIGAMLFASPVVFFEVYWNFGVIFDPVAAFFFFVGILLWTSERRRWWQVLLASLALILSVKGKEMALTMPIILVSYDLLLRKEMKLGMLAHSLLPGGLAVWYALFSFGFQLYHQPLSAALAMRGLPANHPYYMNITATTLASGFGTYFNMLFRTNFSWQIWWIGFIALVLVLALLRNRVALFFQWYTFITFLPVIFLVNHRNDSYWYIPSLGICGLAAMLAKIIYGAIAMRNSEWVTKGGACAVFALLCWGTFLLQKEANASGRHWVKINVTQGFHAFVSGLQALPPPPHGETIFFDSLPPHLEENTLLAATQLAFRRADLQAKLVSEFPADATYRLRFRDSRLIQVPR